MLMKISYSCFYPTRGILFAREEGVRVLRYISLCFDTHIYHSYLRGPPIAICTLYNYLTRT